MKSALRNGLFVVCLAITCWYGMMLVHESGHMAGAMMTGGTVERFEFPLIGFSRTEISPNPHPLIVVWCGPILGAAIPLIFWLINLAKFRLYILDVFAAFCLLSNGLYIGAGSLGRIGDAGDMLKMGSSLWTLWLFGVVATGGGLFLSHRLGPKLGMAHMRPADIVITAIAAVILVALARFH